MGEFGEPGVGNIRWMVLPTAMGRRLLPTVMKRDKENIYHHFGGRAAVLRYGMVQVVGEDAREAVST